jgi:hypothetical protein
MAATDLGTVGNWGVPHDETGILIIDLSLDYSNQEKEVLDKSGEVQGLSLFKEKIEAKMSGLVPRTNAFSGKLGGVLTLLNTMPDHLQSGVTAGKTIIRQVSRAFNNEDHEKIDISATYYPKLVIA